MKKRQSQGSHSHKYSLADFPFVELIQRDSTLREIRKEFESRPPDDRRKAAEWEYNRGPAEQLFRNMPEIASLRTPEYWCEITALAIDPNYAPALITIGSIEYQLNRPLEAMALFIQLTALPADTPDLPIIIDKAAEFLISQDDFANSEKLYAAAAQSHPDVALYFAGLAYCAGKAGRHAEELDHYRRAVELEPENHEFLSDLGYCLTQSHRYEEGEEILTKAVRLAPHDYDLAQGNLDLLREVRAGK